MAKNTTPLFEFSGTVGGVTFVQTKTGSHVRAPRGTWKDASCNESLTTEYRRNDIVNPVAQPVNNFMHAYAPNFKEGGLWQSLLSRIRKYKGNDYLTLLQTIEGLEINPRHTFSKITQAHLEVTHHDGTMTVQVINRVMPPVFPPGIQPNSYYFEVPVLFLDAAKQSIEAAIVRTNSIPSATKSNSEEITFAIPAAAKYYIAFLKIQGCTNGKPVEDHRGMGIIIAKTGYI